MRINDKSVCGPIINVEMPAGFFFSFVHFDLCHFECIFVNGKTKKLMVVQFAINDKQIFSFCQIA